jgi:RNA polymerase sigma-70 factor (ECF subfamily)
MGDINAKRWKGIAECYKRHRGALLRVIDRHVENTHLAEEILHDMFLKLFDKERDLDPNLPTTRNYLLVIARNHVYDFLKKQRWESKNVVNMEMDTLELDARTLCGMEEAVVGGEIISTLHDTLRTLPDSEREIFVRKTFLGHTVLSISKETGMSVFKVNMALRRATRALRSELRDYYPD